jgi:hypothetical protein
MRMAMAIGFWFWKRPTEPQHAREPNRRHGRPPGPHRQCRTHRDERRRWPLTIGGAVRRHRGPCRGDPCVWVQLCPCRVVRCLEISCRALQTSNCNPHSLKMETSLPAHTLGCMPWPDSRKRCRYALVPTAIAASQRLLNSPSNTEACIASGTVKLTLWSLK